MRLLLSTACLFALPSTALAHESGETGAAVSGCTDCHGETADTTTTVSFEALVDVVEPGESVLVTFKVETTDSERTAAGFNVEAGDGTLTAGTTSRIEDGELTHSRPIAATAGATSFQFQWTAPSSEGEVTLYGAGNAVNEDREKTGDGWNTSSITFTVDDGCLDLDEDGVTDCDGDCDDEDPTIVPGADEVCDGVDQDCDGEIDEEPTDGATWYLDDDEDGFGDADQTTTACEQPDGYVADDTDCDDSDPWTYPGAEDDWYDGIDSDCAGNDDDDQDGDGFPIDSDCDDTDETVHSTADCEGDGDGGAEDSGDNDGGSSGDDGGSSDLGSNDGGTDTGAAEGKGGCSVAGGAGGGLALILGALGLVRRRRP